MARTQYATAVEPESARSTRRPAAASATLLATSLGFAVVQLDVSVVNVAIKPIGAALGGAMSALQWVVNAYTIAFAASILTAGALGDRAGAKRVFVAGFMIFTLASAGCGLAPDIGVLVAARVVQGVGAATLVPCSLALLNHTFGDPLQRARAIGLWAVGGSAALSAGPLVGGALIAGVGWRAIFFINAPIGLAGIWLTVRFAAETPRAAGRRIDLPGQIAAAVALAMLTGAAIEGGQRGFTDPVVLAGFGAAALSGAVFVLVERARPDAMLPLGLFRSANFRSASAIGLLVNVAFYGLIFVLSVYLQRARDFSALQTGLVFAPMTLAVMGTNVLAGRAVRALGPRAIIAAGALLAAAGTGALLGLGGGASYPALLGPLMVMGAGLGLIVPPMTSIMLGSVDASLSGIAAGALNAARQTGSALGVAVFGSFLAGHDLGAGLRTTLVAAIILALAVAAATVRITPGER